MLTASPTSVVHSFPMCVGLAVQFYCKPAAGRKRFLTRCTAWAQEEGKQNPHSTAGCCLPLYSRADLLRAGEGSPAPAVPQEVFTLLPGSCLWNNTWSRAAFPDHPLEFWSLCYSRERAWSMVGEQCGHAWMALDWVPTMSWLPDFFITMSFTE